MLHLQRLQQYTRNHLSSCLLLTKGEHWRAFSSKLRTNNQDSLINKKIPNLRDYMDNLNLKPKEEIEHIFKPNIDINLDDQNENQSDIFVQICQDALEKQKEKEFYNQQTEIQNKARIKKEKLSNKLRTDLDSNLELIESLPSELIDSYDINNPNKKQKLRHELSYKSSFYSYFGKEPQEIIYPFQERKLKQEAFLEQSRLNSSMHQLEVENTLIMEENQKKIAEHFSHPKWHSNIKGGPEDSDAIMRKNIKRLIQELEEEVNDRTLGEYKKSRKLSREEEKDLKRIFYWEPKAGDLKKYPGSDKGPNPSDDPEYYGEWMVNNFPKEIAFDLDVERKEIEGEGEEEEGAEPPEEYTGASEIFDEKDRLFVDHKTWIEETDLEYKYEGFEGIYENWIFHDQIQSEAGESADHDLQDKTFIFSSNIHPQEPFPIPPSISYLDQESPFQLEKWSIFCAHSQIFNWNKQMLELAIMARRGLIPRVEVNPPSLFAYYNTLPVWAREHVCIRNIVNALEFTKPLITLKDKELMLNFACSLILPLDDMMKKVFKECFDAKPIRLNMERSRVMLAELKPYWIEPDLIGHPEAENEYYPNEEEEDRKYLQYLIDQENETEIKMSKGISEEQMEHIMHGDPDDKEEELGLEEETESESQTEEENHTQSKKSKSKKKSKQVNVGKRLSRKEIEEHLKETQTQDLEDIHKDFYVKPYPDFDEEPREIPILPIDYYDNDDGFWDDHIAMKQERMAKQTMIVGRPFFKH